MPFVVDIVIACPAEVTSGRPSNWRASCRVVIGVKNEPNTKVRIRLHPQSMFEDQLHHPGFHPPTVNNPRLTP